MKPAINVDHRGVVRVWWDADDRYDPDGEERFEDVTTTEEQMNALIIEWLRGPQGPSGPVGMTGARGRDYDEGEK